MTYFCDLDSIRNNHMEVAAVLVDSGCDVDLADRYKQAPLHAAIRQGEAVGLSSRCPYTQPIPIDDHGNISSNTIQRQNFKPFRHYSCMQCGTSDLQTVQEKL